MAKSIEINLLTLVALDPRAGMSYGELSVLEVQGRLVTEVRLLLGPETHQAKLWPSSILRVGKIHRFRRGVTAYEGRGARRRLSA